MSYSGQFSLDALVGALLRQLPTVNDVVLRELKKMSSSLEQKLTTLQSEAEGLKSDLVAEQQRVMAHEKARDESDARQEDALKALQAEITRLQGLPQDTSQTETAIQAAIDRIMESRTLSQQVFPPTTDDTVLTSVGDGGAAAAAILDEPLAPVAPVTGAQPEVPVVTQLVAPAVPAAPVVAGN